MKISDEAVEAYQAAWEAERVKIGRGIAPQGQKTRAGLEAALPILLRDEQSERDVLEAECDSEKHSWDLFRPEQVDSYWMRCSKLGPHDEHENPETGATWR